MNKSTAYIAVASVVVAIMCGIIVGAVVSHDGFTFAALAWSAGALIGGVTANVLIVGSVNQ